MRSGRTHSPLKEKKPLFGPGTFRFEENNYFTATARGTKEKEGKSAGKPVVGGKDSYASWKRGGGKILLGYDQSDGGKKAREGGGPRRS